MVAEYVLPLYVVKNHKTANNSESTEAVEKINTVFGSLEFEENCDVHLSKLRNNQILQNKISHRFILTTNLLTG